MNAFQGLILAAGHGTRMRSDTVKVLHPIMGRPMLSLVIDAVQEAGVPRPVVVVGHQADQVRDTIGDTVDYVYQEEQRGTGHAVSIAADALRGYENVLILNGDTPMVTARMLARLMRDHRWSGAAATVLTAVVEDPTGLGRVVCNDEGELVNIVEESDASHAEADIREINTGMACFSVEALLDTLPALRPDNAQGEYYLPDAFSVLLERGEQVRIARAGDPEAVIGVNTRRELAGATEVFRLRILDDLMSRGVTIMDPGTTWIHPEVEIQADTVIHPFTTIEGNSRVGSHCSIGPMTHLVDVHVRDEASIWYSVARDSRVGERVTVGPFSHLRPGTDLESGAKVGNFAEVKSSRVGEGSKIPHHSYVGDADVGAGVNMGAGAITVNYDGRDKHRTVLEDGSFIGCNSNLIAPISVGRGAFVAAGSTISSDVPADSLALARKRQRNREGWALRRRKKWEEERGDDDE